MTTNLVGKVVTYKREQYVVVAVSPWTNSSAGHVLLLSRPGYNLVEASARDCESSRE